MKKIKLGLMSCLVFGSLNGYALSAQPNKEVGQQTSKSKFIPQTKYEELLEQFSTPKTQLFNNNNDEGYGTNISADEYKILNELKMSDSKSIMLENQGTKEENEYEQSQPVEVDQGIPHISNFNSNWLYYFPQQWAAYGDAFVTNKNNVFGKQVGLVGHAALGGENRSSTLETAFGTTLHWEFDRWFKPVYRGVQWWTPGEQLYRALPANGTWAQLRVFGASSTQYKSAHDYGASRVGATYNWWLNEGGKGYYCSELVAFAWRFGANRDIIPQKRNWDYIWPMDLHDSPATYVYRGGIW